MMYKLRILPVIMLCTALTGCRTEGTGKQITATDSSHQELHVASPATSTTGRALVTCDEENRPHEGTEDSLIVRTCFFGNFKTVNTGEPDYKGRYSWTYMLLRKATKGYKKVANTELFNEQQAELLAKIRTAIQKDFDDFSKDPETSDCMSATTMPDITMDKLGIEFTEQGIEFNISFDLAGACMNVGGTSVTFSFEQLKPYLKEPI